MDIKNGKPEINFHLEFVWFAFWSFTMMWGGLVFGLSWVDIGFLLLGMLLGQLFMTYRPYIQRWVRESDAERNLIKTKYLSSPWFDFWMDIIANLIITMVVFALTVAIVQHVVGIDPAIMFFRLRSHNGEIVFAVSCTTMVLTLIARLGAWLYGKPNEAHPE